MTPRRDPAEVIFDRRALPVDGCKVAIVVGADDYLVGFTLTIGGDDYTFELAPKKAVALSLRLAGAADAIDELEAVDAGWTARERARIERELARNRRQLQQRAKAALIAGVRQQSLLCSTQGCGRSAPFVVDGVRYCKRHADDAGVRPRGKVV